MLKPNEVEKAVARVKATMEIEGFKLTNQDIVEMRMILEGELDSDELIKDYIEKLYCNK